MRPTAKQRQAIELYESTDPPMAVLEIATHMGVKPSQARSFLLRGLDRLGRDLDKERLEKNPGTTAEVIAAAGNPLNQTVAKIAREAGVSEFVAKGIIDAANRTMPAAVDVVKKVTTARLQDLLDHNSQRILEAVSTIPMDNLRTEGVKDLSVAMSLHLEKRALLRKEPTVRIEIDDRRHMKELLAAAINEMKRRDMTFDGDPVTGEHEVHDGELTIYQRNRVEDGEIVERPD